MRVAYLLPAPGIPWLGPSGASAHARGFARGLAGDHDVRVFVARLRDHRGDHDIGVLRDGPPVTEVGVPWWPRPLGRYRAMAEVGAARSLARAVMRAASTGWAPDLIIERHSLFSDAGWRVHQRLGVPWVLEVNAPPCLERARYETLPLPAWAELWERKVLHAAPVVVGVSRWLTQWLQEDVGCKNVHWVPNGVPRDKGDRAQGRARLGVADEPLVGFLGRPKPWHGVERLPAIAEALGARLVMVGAEGNVPPGALSPGYLVGQDLADVIAAIDLGLAPYAPDAPPWFCPLKVLSYRAQGTPVVAGAIGDVPSLIGGGGTVVPLDDPEAMVAAARSWLGRRVKRRVRSWQSVARKVVSLGTGGPGAPPPG